MVSPGPKCSTLCPLHSTSVNCLSGLLLDCEGSLRDQHIRMRLGICRRLNIHSRLVPIVGLNWAFTVKWKAVCKCGVGSRPLAPGSLFFSDDADIYKPSDSLTTLDPKASRKKLREL
jgi:hypothetical protein